MSKRSLNANSYYWAVVIPHSSSALMYAGWEKERFSHHLLVHKFWKTILNIPSTKDLSTNQFNDYIEDIIRICAVYLNYSIPDSEQSSNGNSTDN